jgi:sarcosine oxidase subunit beta
MKEIADIVVVGGGVIGVSIAYHLAKHQLGEIILLERDSLGAGSTGRSVGSIDSFTLHPQGAELYARSFEFFQHCDEFLDGDCGFTQTGSVVMAGDQHADALREAVLQMQTVNLDVRMLDLIEFSAYEPSVDIEGLTALSFAPQAGYADPALTTQAFSKAARRMGVNIQIGRGVIGLRRAREHVIGVDTNVGPIDVPIVIIAAGPWSGRLLGSSGVGMAFRTMRHPVACLRRPSNFGTEHYSILDLVHGIYARPDSNNLSIFGSIDTKVGYDLADPDDDHGGVPSDYILWAADRFARRYPKLKDSMLCKGWSGMLSVSPDWQPVIGPIPGCYGLYCATGFSGHGFQISPAVGELLAGHIAGEEIMTQLLTPFQPLRFVEMESVNKYTRIISV